MPFPLICEMRAAALTHVSSTLPPDCPPLPALARHVLGAAPNSVCIRTRGVARSKFWGEGTKRALGRATKGKRPNIGKISPSGVPGGPLATPLLRTSSEVREKTLALGVKRTRAFQLLRILDNFDARVAMQLLSTISLLLETAF